MRDGPCVDIGANARLHRSVESLVMEGGVYLVVMLIEAITSIQHSINLQYIAIGIRSCRRIQICSTNSTHGSETLELVPCSIKAKDNLYHRISPCNTFAHRDHYTFFRWRNGP